MLETLEKVISEAAYNAAIQSVGVASCLGMHQMKEPCGLNELAEEEQDKHFNRRFW